MADTPVLNVALIEDHRMRHEAIFKSFENLENGQSFIIRNDHDPLPVFFQLRARNGEVVGWDYEQEGPDHWDVRVTKNGSPS